MKKKISAKTKKAAPAKKKVIAKSKTVSSKKKAVSVKRKPASSVKKVISVKAKAVSSRKAVPAKKKITAKKAAPAKKQPASKPAALPQQPMIYTQSVLIHASPHAVWNAITNPEMTRKYFFNTSVQSDWHKDSYIKYTDSGGHLVAEGEITAIEPNKTLDLKIVSLTQDGKHEFTNVKYRLEEAGHDTLLFVSDGDFSAIENGRDKYRQSEKSWNEALENMRNLLEH